MFLIKNIFDSTITTISAFFLDLFTPGEMFFSLPNIFRPVKANGFKLGTFVIWT